MSDLLKKIALDRDVAAFQELYQKFGPRIKSYMMRQGTDAATAEDLAQETLMTLWRKAELYSVEKGSISTWIFTIARNLRIDRLRREIPWQPLPENYDNEISSDLDPEEILNLQERSQRVRLILDKLPEDQSEVVKLSFIEGLSHSEIAQKLDLPLGTVKSRMRLAYQKVKDALEDVR